MSDTMYNNVVIRQHAPSMSRNLKNDVYTDVLQKTGRLLDMYMNFLEGVYYLGRLLKIGYCL